MEDLIYAFSGAIGFIGFIVVIFCIVLAVLAILTPFFILKIRNEVTIIRQRLEDILAVLRAEGEEIKQS